MNQAKTTLIALVVSLAPSLVFGQGVVLMTGTTSYYRDRDDLGKVLPEAQREYRPLANVRVKAFRKAVIGTDTSRMSNGDASYTLKLVEGAPFHVLFHEDNLVPDLKTLTGDSKKP